MSGNEASFDPSKYRDLFFSEAEKCLELLSGSLAAIEKSDPNGEKEARRAAHTLTGISKYMSFEQIADLAGGLEAALLPFVNQGTRPGEDKILLFKRASDALHGLVQAEKEGGAFELQQDLIPELRRAGEA